MNRQKLLCALLMCFGFSLVYAAAQTQPAAGSPATAPTPPLPAAKVAAVPLPDPKTPQEFFARARQLSDLEASGIPFHLKATYVASGDTEFTGNGTYEEWWQSKDLWRKEATLGDTKYVAIENGGKLSLYGSSDYVPLRLRQMLDAVLIRIAPNAGSVSKWKLKHKKLNGVDLAVLSDAYECGDWKYKEKCVAQDYFTQEGVLRIRLKESVESVYNEFQPFQGRLIARNIGAAGGEGAILTISIESLELLNPSGTALLKNAPTPAHLQPISQPREVKGGITATGAKLVNPIRPIYPMEAKNRGIEGTVVMDASIDATGKVRELFVIHSAGPLLDQAALTAVRQWRYSLPSLNLVPVSMDATISVTFALNH